MRIVLANTLYAPDRVGGAERAVQDLAEGLHERGHRVSVITLGERAGLAVVRGVTVHRLALRNWYWPFSGRAAGAARRAAWHARDFHNEAMGAAAGAVLDAESPHLLHTHNLAGLSVGVWAQAARRALPVVHTLHDYYLMCPPSAMYRKAEAAPADEAANVANCAGICGRCRPFAAYRRHASRGVSAVAGVSRYVLERHLREGFFAAGSRARVIFNAVRAERAAPREAAGEGTTFGFIGRLCLEKGLRWLLAEFTRVAAPRDRLIVAGKGEAGFAEALRAEYPAPAIEFAGHVEAAAFYDRVDVAVVPSLWNEPFGLTVLEALARGLPVIASRRGGIPELFAHGAAGCLVDPAQPGSLGRALRAFSGGGARRGAPAGLARFSPAAALEAYESLYDEALRAPARACA